MIILILLGQKLEKVYTLWISLYTWENNCLHTNFGSKLLSFLTRGKTFSRGTLPAKKANAALHPSDIIIGGITYTINMTKSSPAIGMANDTLMTTYHVSASQHSDNTGALVDDGANGGITGADHHVTEAMDRFVNVEGIDNHVMEKHPIVTAGGVTNFNR